MQLRANAIIDRSSLIPLYSQEPVVVPDLLVLKVLVHRKHVSIGFLAVGETCKALNTLNYSRL